MQQIEILTPTAIYRSHRRTISLIIKENGDFIVRAPLFVSEAKINRFIVEKADWITKKRLHSLNNENKALRLENGEQITLIDAKYTLVVTDSKTAKIKENNIYLPKENTRDSLITLIKKFAKSYLTKRVAELANLHNFQYKSIGVSSAKTNWGSCSYNNRLHFSYHLMLCPSIVVDYIIIHELCHTEIKNHSRLFWNKVAECMPDYKTQEKWLKDNKLIVNLI